MTVLVDGDPRLRVRCAEVGALDATARTDAATLAAALVELRARHGFGRGLAAPQLGIARRMVALDLGAGPFVIFDPTITWHSPEQFELWDDCFSVPDRLVRVRRHASVSVAYRDDAGRTRRWERLPRDLAELLQHELDHLDGVLMLDRALELRPSTERASLVDAARPHHRLSLSSIAEAARSIDPVFRDAPVVELDGLTLVDETRNPIGCFKGRGSDWFVRNLASPTPLVCASAGNFGLAMAYACRARGIPLTVYAATTANPRKLAGIRALGAELILTGDDFDAAKHAARTAAGPALVEDGREPVIAEGAGSLAIELLAHAPDLDTVIVPLGNGALLAGIARWIKAAAPSIRVIGAAALGAPAMEQSWRTDTLVVHDRTTTIADGVAVRVPIPEALADLRHQIDDIYLIDDAAIVSAMRTLHTRTGIVTEPSGAIGLAAALAHRAGRTATILTGGNLADPSLLEPP